VNGLRDDRNADAKKGGGIHLWGGYASHRCRGDESISMRQKNLGQRKCTKEEKEDSQKGGGGGGGVGGVVHG